MKRSDHGSGANSYALTSNADAGLTEAGDQFVAALVRPIGTQADAVAVLDLLAADARDTMQPAHYVTALCNVRTFLANGCA